MRHGGLKQHTRVNLRWVESEEVERHGGDAMKAGDDPLIDPATDPARIRALADAGVFRNNERDDLCEAFGVVTDLLLRRQLADHRAGRRISYFVDPEALPKRRRATLLQSLKVIHALRKRAQLEFTAHLF